MLSIAEGLDVAIAQQVQLLAELRADGECAKAEQAAWRIELWQEIRKKM